MRLTAFSVPHAHTTPPLQPRYPGYTQSYQPPPQYPVYTTTNPYATVSTAQYPGQYAHPSPGALLTTPGYYYMPASTVNVPAATTSTAPTAVQVPTSAVSGPSTVPNTALSHVALPVLAPLVSNTEQRRVSNTNLPASTVTAAVTAPTDHVTVPHTADSNIDRQHVSNSDSNSGTLPGLTPLVSNTDSQPVSNTNLETKCDTLPASDPEPLVSFTNVTVINSAPLPGVETKISAESEAKNSSASTVQHNDANSSESPARVKRSFNPLPRRQPAVKAYLAHEEL